MTKKLAILSILVTLLVSACQFGGVNVSRNEDGTLNADVSLTESDVNTIIQNALAQSGNPLLRDPNVDLQNGQIVVTGTHDKRDGSGSVSGTMTLTVTVNNGALSVQVTALNVEGLVADDNRIAQLNQQLAGVFGQRGLGSNNRAQITAVTITDNALTFTLKVTTQ
jgi:hypothetical protein